MRISMDRFQPLSLREEREIERLQQAEDEMKDEFNTALEMDEAIEEANRESMSDAALRETLLQNYKSIVGCQNLLLTRRDRTIAEKDQAIAELQKQLQGREYAS